MFRTARLALPACCALFLSAATRDPWLRIKSANFEVFTTAGERSGRDLTFHFEQVRNFFIKAFGSVTPDARPILVIAFHTDREFLPYRPNEVAAAYYQAGFTRDYIVMKSASAEFYPYTSGYPLSCCVIKGKRQMAEMLLARGADPNANVYTSGSPLFRAYQMKDWEFARLLEQHGGLLDAVSAGFACQTGAAGQLLADEAAGRLRPGAVLPGSTVSEDLLWSACGGGDPEIVRMALERIDWPGPDSRWLWPLWQAFTCDGGVERGLACFRLLLTRADPNQSDSGRTILHTVMARGGQEHVPYAEMLLDRGARIDIRDDLLASTALGWACRWGRIHFVELLLERGADPVETDAEPWAAPRAWAQKMKHGNVLQALLNHWPK